MRNTLIVLHRWLALVTGLVLLGPALTGAALVFEGSIDRALHPELWQVDPGATPLAIDTLVARVEARLPGSRVTGVSIATVSDRAWTMTAGTLTVFLNPYTGTINGTRTPEQLQATLARRLHLLHVRLVGGAIGANLVPIVTAVALFLILSGVVLWWPDKLVRIRRGASWKRVNFDLHHALGIVAAVVLVVITASGLLIHYERLGRWVRALDRVPPVQAPSQPAGPIAAQRLSFDSVVAASSAALPGARVMFVSLGGPKAPIVTAMRFPEDRTPGGRSRVFLNRFSGAVLGVQSTRTAGLGTRIDNLKRSLHTGDVLGAPTGALWFLAALVLASQVVTGALMWWNRRPRR